MNKNVVLALFALILIGCEADSSEPVKPQVVVENKGFNTIVVDGCEYLIRADYHSKDYNSTEWGYGFMAHKGNCKFCTERRKQELKEIVEQK